MSTLRGLPRGVDPRASTDVNALERARDEQRRREVDRVLGELWRVRARNAERRALLEAARDELLFHAKRERSA